MTFTRDDLGLIPATPANSFDPRSIVQTNNANANNYAIGMWNLTSSLLADFLNEADELSVSSVVTDDEFADLTAPDVNLDLTAPEAPDLTTDLDDLVYPELEALTDYSAGSITIPTFNVIDPEISFPEMPTINYPTDPGDGPALGTIVVPNPPTLDLPDAPTLADIALPSAPEITIPSLDSSMPQFNIEPPGVNYVYEEGNYSSDVLDELKSKLLSDLQNIDETGGMSADVQSSLWTYYTGLVDEELSQRLDELDQYFTDFEIPPMSAHAGRRQALNEANRRTTDYATKQAEQQANLAHDKSKFIVAQAIQLENILIEDDNKKAQRAFESAVATVEAGIKIHNSQILNFNANLEQYKAAAYVMAEQIKANLLTLEQYKARMQGAQIEVEIQDKLVKLYKTQLEGQLTLIEIYKAEMEGAAINAEVQKRQIEGFGETIKAYTAKVGLETAKLNVYQAQLAGENTKVELYKGQIEGHKSLVDASRLEGEIYKINADINHNRNMEKLEQLRVQLEDIKVRVDKELREVETDARVYGYETQAFESQVKANIAVINEKTNIYRANIEKKRVQADIALEVAKIDVQNLLTQSQIQLKSLEAGVGIAAQLAASMLNTIHTSATVGFQTSQSESQSDTRQDSYSE